MSSARDNRSSRDTKAQKRGIAAVEEMASRGHATRDALRGAGTGRDSRRAKGSVTKRTSSIARSIALESWADRFAVFLLIDLFLAAALAGTFIYQCIMQIPEPLRAEINLLDGNTPRTVSWRAGEPGLWDDAIVFTPPTSAGIDGAAMGSPGTQAGASAAEYVFPLSELWVHAIPVAVVTLGIEALSLLGGLTEARRIRRRLRPLNELALVAEAIGSAAADGTPIGGASAPSASSANAAQGVAGLGGTQPSAGKARNATNPGEARSFAAWVDSAHRRFPHGKRTQHADHQEQAAHIAGHAAAGTRTPNVPAAFARLEHAIDAASVDAPSVTTGDKDLQSIEIALNGLLRRMHEATAQQARFVSDASHELRTPIAVIRGYVDMLDRWGKSDEEVLDESIAALKAETSHMQELVEQLLFLARGDAGRQALERAPFDLADLVEEVVEESQMIDADHRYVVRQPTPADGASAPTGANGPAGMPSPWAVVGDRAMVKQALRVIVSNAARYSPTGTPVELGVRANKATTELGCTVEDRGIGMAPGDVAHVFERFYRADAARDRRKEGTGLGLSIAKWIVDAHGGRIDVLTRESLGTRFTLWLPAGR